MSLSKSLRIFPGPLRTKQPCVTTTTANRLQTIAATASASAGVKISVAQEGRRLQAAWGGTATPSTYHSVWLRHNCQCPHCLSGQNQKSVTSYELDPNIAISEANITDGGDVRIKWSSGHEGHSNMDWLRKHCYSSHSLEEARQKTNPDPVTKCILPKMDSRELKEDRGIWRWLKLVMEHGVCLLTNVPCTDEGGYEITNKVSPYLQETFYGGLTRIKVVENPITFAYGSKSLEPHMDIPMYESYPGVNLLQCLRNDECVEGGESIVVDALAVVEKLRVTHPHHFSTLVRVPATFNRTHYDRYPHSVLLVYMDNPVQMVYRTPHIHVNGHGQIVKLRWAPHHDGTVMAAEPYYDAYNSLAKSINEDEQFRIYHRLQPGDVLTMNGFRMLHGRTSIKLNGGVRFLNNFGLNIDDFKSRFMVLCAKFDPDHVPKNVLNHDFSFSTAARV